MIINESQTCTLEDCSVLFEFESSVMQTIRQTQWPRGTFSQETHHSTVQTKNLYLCVMDGTE